jgi:hypothetical protein
VPQAPRSDVVTPLATDATRVTADGVTMTQEAGEGPAGAGAAPAQSPRGKGAGASTTAPQTPRSDAVKTAAADATTPAVAETPVRRSQFTVREDSEKL